MFDLSFGELIVVAVVGLVVLGPKELPVVIRYIRNILASIRATTNDIRQQISDVLDDDNFGETAKPPVRMIKGEDGQYYEAYEISEFQEPAPVVKEDVHDR